MEIVSVKKKVKKMLEWKGFAVLNTNITSGFQV